MRQPWMFAVLMLLGGLLPVPTVVHAKEAPPSGRIQGIVVDANGAPVADVPIRAWSLTARAYPAGPGGVGHLLRDRTQDLVAETTSAADGRWTLTGIREFEHVRIHAAQGKTRAGEATWATAYAVPGPLVRLRVREGQRMRGRLVDADGEGLRGFVEANAMATSHVWGQRGWFGAGQLLLHEPTQDDGTFEVVVPPGHDVRFSGFVPGVGSRYDIRVGSTHPEVVTIPLRTKDGAEVRGSVQDEDGKPVGNALVVVSVLHGGKPHGGILAEAIARTDDSGAYRCRDLPPGDLRQVVVAAEGFRARVELATTVAPMAHVPLVPKLPLEIASVVERGRTLRGQVVDGQGAPIADAVLHPGWQPGPLTLGLEQVRTDAEGRFELRNAPRVAFTLLANKRGYYAPVAEGVRGIAVPPANEAERAGLRLQLVRGESLRGRVAASDGTPIVGASLRATVTHGISRLTAAHHQILFATSEAEGWFTLPGVPMGATLQLQIEADGFVLQQARVEVSKASLATPLTLSMDPSCKVRGRVVDAEGRPVPSMSVYAHDMNRAVVTDAKGAFEIDRIPSGRVTVAVGPLGPPVAARVLDLKPGEVVEGVELELQGTKVLGGIVVTPDRTPQAGVSVSIDRVSGGRGSAVTLTGTDGRFRITHVPDGQYVVRVGPPQRRPRTVPAGAKDLWIEIPSTRRRTVLGMVDDHAGKPVPRGVVSAVLPGDRGGVLRGSAPIFDGRFRMSVPMGDESFTVRVRDAKDAQGKRLNLMPNEVTGVRAKGAPVRLVLPPAKVLTGRVVDVDGAPVVGLLVTCSTHTPQRAFAGPQVPAQTDADGRFVFEGLADVQVRLTIDGNTGWAPPAPVLVASDANDVTLTVARFGTFEGRLVDDEDRPVAGARLTLHHPRTRELVDAPKGYALKRNWQRTVTTGADGRFLLPMVQPGVRPELHGSLPADRARQFLRLHRETIDPHAGPFELKLERGVSVKGRVRDPKGRPIAGVRIVSRSLDGKDHPDLQHSAASDDEGQYEIGAFPRNAIVKLAFELTPIHRQQHLPWLPVRMDRYEVAGGRTLDVTMREGVSIEGVVLDAKPEDLKGFAFLLQSSTKQRAGWHRFDGTSAEFHFVGLEPGRYTMTVSARPRHNRLLIYQTHEIVAPTKTPFEIVPIVQHRVLGRMVGRSPHGYTATFYNYKGRRMSAGVKADGSFDLGTQVNRPGLLILRSTSEAWFVHRDYTPDGKPLNVEPVEGKPIKGRIRGLPGKLKQGTVTAMRGPLKYRAAVAEDGWFELPPMPLGDWEIHFELRMPKRIKFHLPDFVPAGRTNLVVNLP